jgi:hypothetical protein
MAISDPWARAEGPLYDIKGDDTVCEIVYHWNHVKCLLSWKGKEEEEENEKERKEGIKFREFLFLSLSLSRIAPCRRPGNLIEAESLTNRRVCPIYQRARSFHGGRVETDVTAPGDQ